MAVCHHHYGEDHQIITLSWLSVCVCVLCMFVCVSMCVFVCVLVCWCDGVDFGRIAENLWKECWQLWCKKMSGIKVLLTLLISTLTSNISFIFIQLSSMLSGYPASSFLIRLHHMKNIYVTKRRFCTSLSILVFHHPNLSAVPLLPKWLLEWQLEATLLVLVQLVYHQQHLVLEVVVPQHQQHLVLEALANPVGLG